MLPPKLFWHVHLGPTLEWPGLCDLPKDTKLESDGVDSKPDLSHSNAQAEENFLRGSAVSHLVEWTQQVLLIHPGGAIPLPSPGEHQSLFKDSIQAPLHFQWVFTRDLSQKAEKRFNGFFRFEAHLTMIKGITEQGCWCFSLERHGHTWRQKKWCGGCVWREQAYTYLLPGFPPFLCLCLG